MTIEVPVTDERDTLAGFVAAALAMRAKEAGVSVANYMAGILAGEYPPISADELSRQRMKMAGD